MRGDKAFFQNDLFHGAEPHTHHDSAIDLAGRHGRIDHGSQIMRHRHLFHIHKSGLGIHHDLRHGNAVGICGEDVSLGRLVVSTQLGRDIPLIDLHLIAVIIHICAKLFQRQIRRFSVPVDHAQTQIQLLGTTLQHFRGTVQQQDFHALSGLPHCLRAHDRSTGGHRHAAVRRRNGVSVGEEEILHTYAAGLGRDLGERRAQPLSVLCQTGVD